MEIKHYLSEKKQLIEARLNRVMLAPEGPFKDHIEAMRYSLFAGGKRIRPILCLAAAEAVCEDEDLLDDMLTIGAALECIHTYSLIHDDLPAMDNDDLRRGLPTCHVKFDEATAILAGDALLTRAFEVLADPATHPDPRVRSDLVVELARAAGPEGMVGGQMLDLLAEHQSLEMAEVTRLQRMKTGALIAFSCESGAVLGKAADSARQALHAYAHDLGLAFQIADDLLDVEGDEAEVGKKTGKDQGAGKATFVSLLGPERARAQSDMLASQAVEHLEIFSKNAEPLRALAAFVVKRRN